LKQLIAKWMSRWNLVVMPALAKLGLWGVGVVAFVDSSSLPVPMDVILAGYVWSDKSRFWAYCLMASLGSALGGLVPYAVGRAGGELFLVRRFNRQRFEQMRQRFERQEFLAVLVPSMLPPPTPWKAFIFAAGVFEMRVAPFLLAVFVGRMIRWLILSLLVLKLGPGAVSLMERVIKGHLVLFLVVLGLVLAGIATWAIVRRRKMSVSADGANA
jgi:membrane protein YqaA with SNARE-associated domain